MVKYKSRVNSAPKSVPLKNKKDMASKVLNKKTVVSKVTQRVAPVIKKVAPTVRAAVQRRLGASLPVGGVLPSSIEPLSDSTIDQMTSLPFIHMLGTMDMSTFHMLQGIASNFLRTEHPLRAITQRALGGSFDFPKNLSKIAMRDVLKASTPQQLSHALHGEWVDMMSGKLSPDEVGGGLFSSLKTLVKKGVAGGKKALSALAAGAAGAVRAVSAGAMGAQMIGKSVSNALMQGLEVANSLSPIIQEVFPSSEGILKAGLGHANAANELVNRGINIAGQVEKAVAPVVSQLGPIDAPIIVRPASASIDPSLIQQPIGAGLDTAQVTADDVSRDDTGPRFVS